MAFSPHFGDVSSVCFCLFVCILYLYHLALGNAANPILAHLVISVSEDAVFILILRCLSYA